MQYTFRPILQWPRPLTRSREWARFKSTYTQTLQLLERELSHLGARNVVLQVALRPQDIRNDGLPRANARPAEHPGVILSFETKAGAISMPCDRFTDWEDNLRALALSLEALRKVDRYGVTQSGEQYRGWQALPMPSSNGVEFQSVQEAAGFVAQYSDVLTSEVLNNPERYKFAYRAAAARLHPDVPGGDTKMFQRLQAAAALLKGER